MVSVGVDIGVDGWHTYKMEFWSLDLWGNSDVIRDAVFLTLISSAVLNGGVSFSCKCHTAPRTMITGDNRCRTLEKHVILPHSPESTFSCR
jgi:hypothetical protein